MEPNAQGDQPPPRRTLADLPPELKATIARMARDQDVAHKARVTTYGPLSARARSLAILGKSDRDGKSAHALALVDRSWNSAVAPLMFETTTSENCSAHLFGFRIAPKYGRFVKSANFGSTSPLDQHEEYLSLLRALPFFVNLEHITLTEETIESLFEPKVADDVATLQEALRMAAPSISGLTIYTSDPTAFEYLLPMFVNLRRFAWPVTHEDDWTRILPAVQVLGRCNLLEHLDLECAEEELFTLLLSEGVDSRAWPSLLSLKLHLEGYEAGDRIGMAAWRFIQSFNNTLESITLTLGAHLSDDLIAESDTPPHAFPNLRLLTIKSAYHGMDFIPLLKLFSASRIRHLVLLPYGNGMDDDSPDSLPSTALFETVLRLFPHHLQSVRLEYNHVVPGIHHLRSITPALAPPRLGSQHLPHPRSLLRRLPLSNTPRQEWTTPSERSRRQLRRGGQGPAVRLATDGGVASGG